MAVIHRTTLKPTKLELLTAWLPSRPWYVGGPGEPELAKAGGFRLDDPAGEVGIEFMVVTDTSGASPTAYLAPLTYRGAPLDGKEHALVGTSEHGVLGQRWIYDACHDPVAVSQLLALIDGLAQAQHQSISDTPDPDVTSSYAGDSFFPADFTLDDYTTVEATDDQEGTELLAPNHAIVRVQRVLRPAPHDAPALPADATGHVAGVWQMPDGTRERGLFVAVYAGRRA